MSEPPVPSGLDDLISAKAAAEIAEVSFDTVYRWIREGRVPGVLRLPTGRYRISRKAWLEFLAECRIHKRTGET